MHLIMLCIFSYYIYNIIIWSIFSYNIYSHIIYIHITFEYKTFLIYVNVYYLKTLYIICVYIYIYIFTYMYIFTCLHIYIFNCFYLYIYIDRYRWFPLQVSPCDGWPYHIRHVLTMAHILSPEKMPNSLSRIVRWCLSPKNLFPTNLSGVPIYQYISKLHTTL